MKHVVVASLLATASGLPFFSPAHAQEKTILQGRAVTAAGEPVPSLTVSLHRVVGESGTVVGQGLSGQEGRFEIEIPPDSSGNAVYFAATDFQGEMYIGQPFRPPLPPDVSYLIIVGPGGVSASAANAAAGPAPVAAEPQRDVSPRAVLLILAAIALTMAAVVLLVRRRVPPDASRRRALLEMAILEENAAARPLDQAERAALDQKRAEMRRRLTASSG
jgi:hypothetical protein